MEHCARVLAGTSGAHRRDGHAIGPSSSDLVRFDRVSEPGRDRSQVAASGRRTVNVVPASAVDVTSTEPSWLRAIWATM